jgi:hypothetical protein
MGAGAAAAVAGRTFTPPSGKQVGCADGSPGAHRLLGATSKDGLTFTPLGTVISDQANVPDVVADSRGTLHLYYTGASVGGVQNGLAVATSSDGGRSWTHKVVQVQGENLVPVDPDVALLPDGTFRLWYTSGERNKPQISWAEGKDGVTFTRGGVAFAPSGGAMDSTAYKVGNTWHMIALDTRGQPTHHATSTDGRTFTASNGIARLASGFWPSNGVNVGNAVRMFAFREDTITSFLTRDGVTFTREDGARIPPNPRSRLESDKLQDATAAQLPDGSWFAAYVTPIP